jgi:Ni/Fe-hydrogenase 1 B-type cytochrome subunit
MPDPHLSPEAGLEAGMVRTAAAPKPSTQLADYRVWDLPTRLFHWINAICVIALAVIGFLILNAKGLEIPNGGKVTLKTVHTWFGYVFVLNLGWRILWGFVGNRHARWRQVLPLAPGYVSELRRFLAARRAGQPVHYLGHNPLGRLAVMVLLLLLAVQAATGLVLAGTDIYYPPFGAWIAKWIAAPGVDPATLAPYSPQMYDPAAYDAMRALRKPFALVHLYSFYALMFMVVLHVAAVIVTEVRGGATLISAMFTGRKVLPGKPVDEWDAMPHRCSDANRPSAEGGGAERQPSAVD